MSRSLVKEHWMVDVMRQSGFGMLQISSGLSPAEIWSAAQSVSSLTEDELARKVSAHFHLSVADVERADHRIMKLVPEKIARRYGVLPLSASDRQLQVATSDPSNFQSEQSIAFASGRSPVFSVAAPTVIQKALDRWYSPEKVFDTLLASVDKEINDDAVMVVQDREPEAVPQNEIDAAPVVKLTNAILRDAVRQGSSDIHIEPSRDGGVIRFRVDGVLRTHMQLPIPALNRIVSRLKVMGKLDISDRLRPQDGRARVQVDERTYDLRFSTIPTRDSEKAVIRVLNSSAAHSLDDLKLAANDLGQIHKLLANREGMILVTGPTGSGKTTTLYGALRHLATETVNITTVEDPVEYELAGIAQVQVDKRRNVTFANVLRSILRQDPDVILVGEIRDAETAHMAVEASMTGHLVLSTLHTNDAVGAIARLTDLGLDRPTIGSTLKGIVAQRLIRRVCVACAQPIRGDLSKLEEQLAATYATTPKVRALGCPACGQSGYRGRIPLQEILTVTSRVKDAIFQDSSLAEVQQIAVEGGMRSLRSAGIARVLAGETTIEELDRVLGDSGDARAATVVAPEKPSMLIVDDDALNRRLARSIMEKQGYGVTEAVDGIEALEKVAAQRFTLIVLDLEMPRMPGQEVLAKLKSSPGTAGIPVVVLTSSDNEEAETQLMEQGADDYMTKPLDPGRFTARVKAVLRRMKG